jgi:hypothetical protein
VIFNLKNKMGNLHISEAKIILGLANAPQIQPFLWDEASNANEICEILRKTWLKKGKGSEICVKKYYKLGQIKPESYRFYEMREDEGA